MSTDVLSQIVRGFNITCIALPIFIIVINLLMGLKKGLSKSIVKIIRVVISVVLAVIITRVLINAGGSTAFEELKSAVGDNEIMTDILAAAPSLENYVLILLYLVAPIVFLFVYLLVSLILLIPAGIVNAILKKKNIKRQIEGGEVEEFNENGKRNKIKVKKMRFSGLFGMLIYGVAGFIIAFAILMPFTNYTYRLTGYYVQLEDQNIIKPTDDGVEISSAIREANSAAGIKFAANVSSPLFNALTDYTSEDVKSNVFKDVDALMKVVPYAIELSEQKYDNLDNIDLTPLRKIINQIDEMGNFKLVLTEFLAAAGEKWGNNEKFLGIDLSQSIDPEFQPYTKKVFDKLASIKKGDTSSVTKTLNTFVDTIEDVLKIASEIKALAEENFEEIEALSTDPLHAVGDILKNSASTLTKEIVAEVMSDAGYKWYHGEAFMGLNIQDSLPAGYEHSLDRALKMLMDTTPYNVGDNVNTFADAIETIKKTYVYVTALSDSEMNMEDLKENLVDVLESLTPESADIVAGAITGDMLESANIPEESRETVSDLISGVISGVAELPEEERAAEAEALNNLITYATDETAETADPKDVVATIAESSVLSQQIVEYAAIEETGSISVSEGDQERIENAIAEYQSEHPDADPELMAAIQSLFGIQG